MSTAASPSPVPYYSASCTLLYADPDVEAERPYLQPLYGCTGVRTAHDSDGSNNGSEDEQAHGTRAVLQDASVLTHVTGPQPVYGGAALLPPRAHDTHNNDDAVHLHADGTPLLATLLDEAQTARLRALRSGYAAPHARSGSVGLSCVARGSLLVHGGLGDAFYNDTWEYDVHTRRWRELHCTAAAAATTHDACSNNNNSNSGDNNDSFPPPAYGQAGVIYRDARGQACLGMYGGIMQQGACCNALYSLALDTCVWSRLPLSMRLPPMWGATAQVLHLRERRNDDDGGGGDEDDEVMVMFGGMTRVRCVQATFLLHLRRPLRAEEVYAHPQRYLDSSLYARIELHRIVAAIVGGKRSARRQTPHRVYADRDADEEDSDDDDDDDDDGDDDDDDEWAAALWPRWTSEAELSGALRGAVAAWRRQHADVLHCWRAAHLRRMIGTYWVECLPNPPTLPGRRRPCSAAYRRHFLVVFGGRYEAFYNDMWVLNVLTRQWVQLRREVPVCYVRALFDRPGDDAPRRAMERVLHRLRARDRARRQRRQQQRTLLPSSLGRLVARNNDDEEDDGNNANNEDGAARRVQRLLNDDNDNNDNGDGDDTYHDYGLLASEESYMAASPHNSTALPRTGACMAVDPLRHCLYVYGGFAFVGVQQQTFYDLHVYHIREHMWRRVPLCPRRDWDAHVLDAWAVVRTHATPARPPPHNHSEADSHHRDNNNNRSGRSRSRSGGNRRGVAAGQAGGTRQHVEHKHTHMPRAATATAVQRQEQQQAQRDAAALSGTYIARPELVHGMGVAQYIAHYCATDAPPQPRGGSSSDDSNTAYPPPLIVPAAALCEQSQLLPPQQQEQQQQLLYINNNSSGSSRRQDMDGKVTASSRWLALPVLTPAARTMACLMTDPLCPGSRFFLFGGRNDEAVYGDLFELRVRAFTHLDEDYGTAQHHDRLQHASEHATATEQHQPHEQSRRGRALFARTLPHILIRGAAAYARATITPPRRPPSPPASSSTAATSDATRHAHQQHTHMRHGGGNSNGGGLDDMAVAASYIYARMRARTRADADMAQPPHHTYCCGVRVDASALHAASRGTLAGAAAGMLRDVCTFLDHTSSTRHVLAAHVVETLMANARAAMRSHDDGDGDGRRAAGAAAHDALHNDNKHSIGAGVYDERVLSEARVQLLHMLVTLFVATADNDNNHNTTTTRQQQLQHGAFAPQHRRAVAPRTCTAPSLLAALTDLTTTPCHRVLHALLPPPERWDATRVLHERRGPAL